MSERISIDADVCNGRPVIRGTRITVQAVLEFLAAGDSIEDVLEIQDWCGRTSMRVWTTPHG